MELFIPFAIIASLAILGVLAVRCGVDSRDKHLYRNQPNWW
jgi:hypothetical protein